MSEGNNMTPPSRVGGVTVIVCCFNSSPRIAATLKHLCEQQLPSNLMMEVLIVDNASEDDLMAVIQSEWKPLRDDYILRIVEQPVSGLANARMKGVEEAAFDYAIFCDDDNWLCPTYVAAVHSHLSNAPSIGIVGGASTPRTDGELPSWFYSNAFAYAVGVQAESSGDVTDRQYVWGAGMGFYLPFLRKAYDAGARPILPDRTGRELLSGNDTEICFWFIMAGYQLWYDERLEFEHFIPKGRIQKDYLDKVKEGFRKIDPILRSYKSYLVLLQTNYRKTKSSSKTRWSCGRYLKAICIWYLTDPITRTKIKGIKELIEPISYKGSVYEIPINR